MQAIRIFLAFAFTVGAGLAGAGCFTFHSLLERAEPPPPSVALNPYEGVDWESVEHHKAALHTHTLQSDGHQMPGEVVRAYHRMGFTVLALTDHDYFRPNYLVRTGVLPQVAASPFPREGARPPDFPLNTTWPWPEFGAPSPQDLEMVGVEGAELSRHHHMGSYFNSYGAPAGVLDEDEQLRSVRDRGGLAVLFHPGVTADRRRRHPVEWYEERFLLHPPKYLIGIEVTNAPRFRETYDEGLWDQLLARLLPERPVWGFGTDDMHDLRSVPESHTVLLVNELSEGSIREALESGRFYFRKSTRSLDFLGEPMAEDPFPSVHAIEVDEEEGTIRIHASNHDRILWISAPEVLEPLADHADSHEPWAPGRVVEEGEKIRFRTAEGVDRYLRIELHRNHEGHLYRTFTNPLGVRSEPRGK